MWPLCTASLRLCRDGFRPTVALAVALAVASALGACGSSSPDTSPAAAQLPATSAAALSAGCSWLLVSDPDLLNIALPDAAATYWVSLLPYLPGTRVRIDGHYPKARYFSFNAYGPLLSPVDGIADYRIAPAVPGTNPYQQADAAYGMPYTVYVVPQPKPESVAVNTVYSGEAPLVGNVALPVNPLMLVLYRVYLGEGDIRGGVPLPVMTLETADGSRALATLDLGICEPLPPGGLVPDFLNAAIAATSLPAPLDGLVGSVPLPLTPAQPQMVRNYGIPEALRQSLSTALGVDLPLSALTTGVNLSLLPNVDNAYLDAILSRDKSSLYILRGKAPVFAQQPSDAPLGSAQLRYWSLCTNELLTQRFVQCAADRDVPLDPQGYFTVVVSDPDQRPANAVASNGIGWLAWGSIYPDSMILYRHMLPSPGFGEAIQNIPFGTPAQAVMKEYYPLITYCDRATIESAGDSAAAVFAACRKKFGG